LSEEKSILRQIDQIQKTKIQIDENEVQERAIQDKKSEIDILRNQARNMTAQIAELESAIAKIELAKRLGCTTNDLLTSAVDCPVDKLGEIIGKGGSNIKQLEQKTGCIIDVDQVKGQIHLRGNEDAIRKAVLAIESITLSLEEEFPLSSEVHSFLIGNVSYLNAVVLFICISSLVEFHLSIAFSSPLLLI
jgi:polyribonucleotide nucleotidyltransferase